MQAKYLTKIQHPCKIKTHRKIGIEGDSHNLINSLYKNLQLASHLMVIDWKLMRQGCPLSLLLFNIIIWKCSQLSKGEVKNVPKATQLVSGRARIQTQANSQDPKMSASNQDTVFPSLVTFATRVSHLSHTPKQQWLSTCDKISVRGSSFIFPHTLYII